MPFYTINGLELHTLEEGNPNRQVALLIHGWSSSWYALSPLMKLISQRFRCIAVDLPGYGHSTRLPERTTIRGYADLLAEFLSQVSDGPAVLIGHSMGGMTSVTLALHYRALVERMVLLAPTITGKLSSYINLVVLPVTLMERFGLGSLIVSLSERIFLGVTDRIMRPASFAERSGITLRDYGRLRADARSHGQGRVRAECFRAMRENDLSTLLREIEAPSLVIWGAEDNTVPLRDAGVIADEWPDCDLRILPNAGHWPQFEAPDPTRRLIASYLGLPLSGDSIQSPVGNEALMRVTEIAQFLAHSDVGNNLNQAQRIRLAAQFVPRTYKPGEKIVTIAESGSELYVIYQGTLEVWSDPERPGEDSPNKRHVADLWPGQIAGEMALFDEGLRSADLMAGQDGATVLSLARQRLIAVCEDDAVLGTRLLWNISGAISRRVRYVLWQWQRTAERMREQEREQAVAREQQPSFEDLLR
ncbi:MAG: alpha/beta fold hydrolase [Anaerolineae bacterium]|nr:alpha/beta fold hydrolase [Anaerolineae bacterium]